jgi:hypothetical protein
MVTLARIGRVGTQGSKHGLGALSFANVCFVANNKDLIHKSKARSDMPPGYGHSADSMECTTLRSTAQAAWSAAPVEETHLCCSTLYR